MADVLELTVFVDGKDFPRFSSAVNTSPGDQSSLGDKCSASSLAGSSIVG
jgi:hypothetical protein